VNQKHISGTLFYLVPKAKFKLWEILWQLQKLVMRGMSSIHRNGIGMHEGTYFKGDSVPILLLQYISFNRHSLDNFSLGFM